MRDCIFWFFGCGHCVRWRTFQVNCYLEIMIIFNLKRISSWQLRQDIIVQEEDSDEGDEEESSDDDDDDEEDDTPAEFDEREGYGSGTTACVALVKGGVITVANVGTFLF